jgi:lipooligosaccharide transport system permease protein
MWRARIVAAIGPGFYLSAIGLGLGSLVDRHVGELGVSSYVQFLAPGLLAATAMQTAASDNSYPVFGSIHWSYTYHLMLTTPLRVWHLAVGELLWTLLRQVTVLLPLFIFMMAVGTVRGFLGMLAFPAAVLTGLAFGPAVAALSASFRNYPGVPGLHALMGLFITPLFLLGGTFFPITLLPEPLQVAAWATPLFHGVALTRGLTEGNLQSGPAALHVGVLVCFVLAGVWAARVVFERRLAR